MDCEQSVPRVQGVLAVSRGLGDIDLKEFITAEPDVSTHRITRDCEFVILASDGLWDVVRPRSLKSACFVDWGRHFIFHFIHSIIQSFIRTLPPA